MPCPGSLLSEEALVLDLYYTNSWRAVLSRLENHKSSVSDSLKWVLTLFEGEKTNLFWAGLIILSLASLWLFALIYTLIRIYLLNAGYYISENLPQILGAAVFILIGYFMMKSGVKKKKATPRIVPLNAA